MSARILAVEDTPALRALLQLCLTRAGYQTDLAEEGQSAVEMFLAGTYDAAMLTSLGAMSLYLERVSVVYS